MLTHIDWKRIKTTIGLLRTMQFADDVYIERKHVLRILKDYVESESQSITLEADISDMHKEDFEP